jgi:dipeptide/tripeptide permease
MFYLGIALATLGAIMLIVGIILAFASDESFLILFFCSFIPLLISVGCFRPDANIKDVRDGKAQQVLYTTYGVTDNGDTISCEKTYRIEWKEEWKHGRKRY